jgi:hypothetical protein
MRNRVLTCFLVAGFVAGILPLLTPSVIVGQGTKAADPAPAKAGAWTPPKTPWGDPDIQGIFTSDDYIGVSMARPANAPANQQFMLSDAEIATREANIQRTAQNDLQQFAAANARAGTGPPSHWAERAKRAPRQNWMVVDPPDGRIPATLPEARNRRQGVGANNNDPRPDSWEDFSYYIRCITRGVTGSIFPVIYGNGTEIVQGPGYVAIMQEMVHEARIIPLNGGPHVSDSIRSYMGDSRGRFDGNTLVVETTNFLPGKTGMGANGGGVPTSEALKLTERFTRIDPDTIKYEVTIDDPKTYQRPWTVSFPIYAEPGYQLFEYACHEGNYAMTNSLSGARAQDKAEAEAAGRK